MYASFVHLLDAPGRGIATSLADFGAEHRHVLLDRAELHGAVWLRGFRDAYHPDHFAAFGEALGLAPFDAAESAAPRAAVTGRVVTANEAPPSEVIPFHHEMAQAETAPTFLLFYCQTPARMGGATSVVRSRDVAEYVWRARPREAAALQARGVRYVRTLPPVTDPSSPIGRSWREAFGVDTRAEAEAALAARGIEGRWRADGSLRTVSPRREVFGVDPEGRRTFFNSAVAARRGWRDARNDADGVLVFGDDGAPLDVRTRLLFHLAGRFMDAHATHVHWGRGDVLLLDNRQVLHARQPFVPPRRVLASLWGDRAREVA